MRIQISLSGTDQSVSEVLRKIALTIVSKVAGGERAPSGEFVYTANSCYGSIAHHLRTHWNKKWEIMLFGGDSSIKNASSIVVHAILYDPTSHTVLVDTFAQKGGQLRNTRSIPTEYSYARPDPSDEEAPWLVYALQKRITLAQFAKEYRTGTH